MGMAAPAEPLFFTLLLVAFVRRDALASRRLLPGPPGVTLLPLPAKGVEFLKEKL